MAEKVSVPNSGNNLNDEKKIDFPELWVARIHLSDGRTVELEGLKGLEAALRDVKIFGRRLGSVTINDIELNKMR